MRWIDFTNKEVELLLIIIDEAEDNFKENDYKIYKNKNKDKEKYLEVLNWNNINFERLKRINKKLL